MAKIPPEKLARALRANLKRRKPPPVGATPVSQAAGAPGTDTKSPEIAPKKPG